jgi:hypothetical protein
MLRIFYFLLLLFSIGCSPKYIYLRKGNYICETLKKEFIASNLVGSKDMMIPQSVLNTLSKEFHEDFTFAKYGEEYNNTDLSVYPNKRIILTGISQDSKLGFAVYEKGGLVISNYLILYKTVDKKVYSTTFFLEEKYSTMELLKKNIQQYACF